MCPGGRWVRWVHSGARLGSLGSDAFIRVHAGGLWVHLGGRWVHSK